MWNKIAVALGIAAAAVPAGGYTFSKYKFVLNLHGDNSIEFVDRRRSFLFAMPSFEHNVKTMATISITILFIIE